MRRLFLSLFCATLADAAPEKPAAPLFRDFVGLNGHTIQFKPELYAPVCKIVRDFHPVAWDLEKQTAVLPEWPFAKNRVNWDTVYKPWREKGLRISACLIFDEMQDIWKNHESDAEAYGRTFAANFGPGGRWPHVDWVEIGNEPGLFTDEAYLKLFTAMARGIREGNPKLPIVTCNVEAEGSDRYWKGANLFKENQVLWDVLQIHRYGIKKGWPDWVRSYPEDPDVPYLSRIKELLVWRDQHTPGKPLWVTEFGYDCSTKKPDSQGANSKFTSCTDTQQAQWLVRSFFHFASMGVAKAFVFFFDDKDEPSLHAASGITRNYQPKPSYHSLAWMLRSLENHRFASKKQDSLTEGYVFEFTPEKPTAQIVWAVWHATEAKSLTIPLEGQTVIRAEKMPHTSGEAAKADFSITEGQLTLQATEDPILLWLTKK